MIFDFNLIYLPKEGKQKREEREKEINNRTSGHIMSRRRASHSEQLSSLSTLNEASAYPFSSSQQHHQQLQQNNSHNPNHVHPQPRRGPVEGPNGRRLIRRVTWRSSTYKLMASLWVLGVFYIVWLIRDLFYLPFNPATDGVSSPADE